MKKVEQVQCYQFFDGKMYIAKKSRYAMKKDRFYESPLDAIDKELERHKYCKKELEYKLSQRNQVIDNLERFKQRYLNGENIFPTDDTNNVNVYSGIKY